MCVVELFPVWAGGNAGYYYNVLLDGDVVLEHSRDPETDLARVLLSRGIAGKVTVLDGKTGKPRTIINIKRAAKLRVIEPNNRRIRFATWVESGSGAPYSALEPELVGVDTLGRNSR
jgi:hypothetical protein